MNEPKLTKGELATMGIDALNTERAGLTTISRQAGGVSFATALEVMDFAKLMSIADKAVPRHLRLNAGACLRIVFQAVEWRMSPWAVADKSYEVNDRIAYESQLIHAVIEARAPLRERLTAIFTGEGADRACEIHGTFTDGSVRTYRTPLFKDIRPKNSPLWVNDPDQQLFYYATRAWSRRWCPDVIMGLYTKEELQAAPQLGRPDEEPESGLHARLIGSNINREEGHQDGHVERQIAEMQGESAPTEGKEAPAEAAPKKGRGRPKKQPPEPVAAPEPKAAEPEAAEPEPAAAPGPVEAALPKNPAQWATYCRAWLAQSLDPDAIRARWNSERQLRNGCGVTSEEREPIMRLMEARCEDLQK